MYGLIVYPPISANTAKSKVIANIVCVSKMDFKNKVVIVTGASSGIGASVAIAFSSAGAKVVMVGRNETKLKKVAVQCKNPVVFIADMTQDDNYFIKSNHF